MAATELTVEGTRFLLNNTQTFLLGVSYYGALGTSEAFIQRDLDDMQGYGFNWIRVWATWAAFGNDVSAVDAEGQPRNLFLSRLEELVRECDRREMVVDVTLSRGNGVSGPSRLQTVETHRQAAETLVKALQPYRNWYLDLGNERNLRDLRFVSYTDLKHLRDAVKKSDPRRLVTASHAGDISQEELREYLLTVQVDFLAPHRPRHPQSPRETDATSRKYLGWMQEIGRTVPLHYQEPFRRGFRPQRWEPSADAFLTDVQQAVSGGAAGWCFHNGDQKDRPEARPRRSFDLREECLFEQLDEEEQKVIEGVGAFRSL